MDSIFKSVDAFADNLIDIDASENMHEKENEILHSVLNSLSEGVIVADETGKFLYFNPSAKQILGLGSKDVMIEEWTSVYGCFYPDTVTPFPSDQLPLARAIRNEEVVDEVLFIRNEERPHGVYIDISASPLKDRNGEIRGGTVIFRDITKMKHAEMSSLNSEARLKAQFKGIPMPAYVWQKVDHDFFLIDFNDAAEGITQHSIHDLIGRKVSDIYGYSPEIQDYFHQCIESHNGSFSKEMSFPLQATGEERDLIAHFVHVPPDMVLVHTEDVTHRKANERELRKLSNAVEQTADSVIITDKNGLIEYVNPAFETTTGYLKEEMIGQTASLLKSGKHSPSFYHEIWETISGGHPYKGMIINKKKTGDLYWSEQTITPMKDEKGEINHFVSVLRDITKQREQQEQDLQIKIARDVQSQLYNREISIPGLEVSGSTIPAAETNGDYYDIIPMDKDTYGIVIGDVSGHGIGSAMIMTQTRAYLHAFMKHDTDPGILLTCLNHELAKDLRETHFVTLVLIRIDMRNKRMDYASAGHLPGYLLDQSGKTKQVMESTGIPLGFLPDYKYEKSHRINLKSGDYFVLLTDGIVEAHDLEENEFGLERALEVVKENSRRTTSEIHEQLHQAVDAFSSDQPQEDDLTSVIGKIQFEK
ncbi:SpoIIE family protein phosphatase [candidate division KSB1 bacterium]|nr:SpoIIE family protein phosphatase [candidate division KSB1 bacterium]